MFSQVIHQSIQGCCVGKWLYRRCQVPVLVWCGLLPLFEFPMLSKAVSDMCLVCGVPRVPSGAPLCTPLVIVPPSTSFLGVGPSCILCTCICTSKRICVSMRNRRNQVFSYCFVNVSKRC